MFKRRRRLGHFDKFNPSPGYDPFPNCAKSVHVIEEKFEDKKCHEFECIKKIIDIEDSCIIEVCDEFFLLVELESDICCELNTFVAIKICWECVCKLIRAGVKCCQICCEEPSKHCCHDFRCICIINIKGETFKVFVVKWDECDDEEIILVPTEHCCQ